MTAFSVHLARGLFDASTANGGAIDGAILPLVRLDVLLTMVALGIAIAQHSSAKPAGSLGLVFVATLGSAVAGLRALSLPASEVVRLCASVCVISAAVVGPRLPWWLAAGSGALFAGALVSSATAAASSRGVDYAVSFGAALALSVTATTLSATAAGFMCLRSTRALVAARALAGLAGAAAVASAVLP